MSEQGGKLFRLADHPRFKPSTKDPELVEVAPGAWLTRAEIEELEIPEVPDPERDIDWENEGIPLTPCEGCKYAEDRRTALLKYILGAPELSDLKCSVKAFGRCELLNPEGSCDDFDVDIFYS
ncbi:hypothetical protein LCGC14_2845560 [marine sediment metagenome]|uniref:Uncharacterized protein n=1 Tax=marine sediment metagenome TaxID=412755 RepID=A0A0F8Y9Y3_9ZZZZ